MNLATARAMERAREIGIRKVVGAYRRHLIGQFLTESLLFSVIAVVNALVIVVLVLPAFRSFSGKDLATGALMDPSVLGLCFAVALGVGLVAGSYPALVLSRFQPALVLKGSHKSSRTGIAFRKGLVVFQFGITVALIAGTSIVLSQLDFMQSRPLGFEKEQMLTIDFGEDPQVIENLDAVRAAFQAHPAVSSVSITRNVPGSFYTQEGNTFQNADGEQVNVLYNTFQIDHEFISHFGIELAAGRSYDRDNPNDLNGALIINETAARVLGYTDPNDAVGTRFSEWQREGEIIGVVKDFNYVSLQKAVDPLTLSLRPTWARFVVLKLQTENIAAIMTKVEQIWKQTLPFRPFLYSFLDDSYDQQYRAEVRFGQTAGLLAGIAIFIACLGLFGLVSSVTAQRTKEIGVRKVMGASVARIALMLSREFAVLVVIAIVLATPAIYLLMDRWLEAFAFRTSIGAGSFLLAGGLSLLIAILTVKYQTIRAAIANPVESLRSE